MFVCVSVVGLGDAKLAGKTLGVERADAEGDERSGIAEDSVLQAFRQLRNCLVRRDQRETPLARFREDRCETVGREVLELVDIQREVAALVLRHVPPRFGRLRARGDEKRAEKMRGLGAEIAFRQIDDEHFALVHHVRRF